MPQVISDWGTDQDFSPTTDAGVMGPPTTGNAAEPTAGESSTPTEGSQAEGSSAAKPPVESGKPEDKKEPQDYSDVPFNKHPRFQQLYNERKEFESKLNESKAVLGALAEKGIHSPDDAAFVVQQRDEAQQQVQQLTAQFTEFREGFTKDPIQFGFRLKEQNPQAWGFLSYNVLYGGLLNEAKRLETAAVQASKEIPAGESFSERDRLLDQAQFVKELATGLDSRYKSNAQRQPTPNANQDQKLQEIQRREREQQEREDNEWVGKIGNSVDGEVTSRIDKFVKGVEFIDDEQKQDFYDAVMSKLRESLDQRDNFIKSSWQEAMGNRSTETLSAVAKRYGLESERGGLLEGIIAKRLRMMGLEAKSREANRQATVAKASERREVARGGQASGGPDMEARKAEIFAQIDKEYPIGSIENSSQKTTWRSRL